MGSTRLECTGIGWYGRDEDLTGIGLNMLEYASSFVQIVTGFMFFFLSS